MNRETYLKILISSLLILAALIIYLMVDFFRSYYFIVTSLISIISFFLILEFYLRIQHNIDKSKHNLALVGRDFKMVNHKINQQSELFNVHLNELNNKFVEQSELFGGQLNELNDRTHELIDDHVVEIKKEINSVKDNINSIKDNINSVKDNLSSMENKISSVDSLSREYGKLVVKNERSILDIKFAQGDLFRVLFEERMKKEANSKEDVTVIIGVRNRYDYRIHNSLKSLRAQIYSSKLIKILIVDYGSDEEFIPKLKEVAKEYDAEYLRVDNVKEWNRSKCMNIALKKVNTKYLLISDVDIVFEKRYIEEAVNAVKENIFRAVYAKMKLTNPGDVTDETDVLKSFNSILAKARTGSTYPFGDYMFWEGMSIVFGLKELFYLIGGYDENFRLWGCEDCDIIRRFRIAGVEIQDISKKAQHFHQWHPHYEGVSEEKNLDEQVKWNHDYMRESKSIFTGSLKRDFS